MTSAAELAAPRLRVRWAAIRSSLDLVLLAALLVPMALFGRPFAKIQLAPHIYPAEVLIAAAALAAVARTGVAGALARIRDRLPLRVLGLYWLGGAIAVARGVHTSTASQVLHDIGLVEYSLLVPLVAVVADSAARLRLFAWVIVAAGIGAAAVYFVVYNFYPSSELGGVSNPGSGVGIYLALAVFPALAAILHRRPHALALAPALVVGVVLMSMTVSRGTLLALIAGLCAAVFVAPHGKRLVMVGLAAATLAVSIGGASLATRLRTAMQTTPTPSLAVIIANPNYVADDAATGVLGGTPNHDAVAGKWSRRVDRRSYYIAPYITHLQPNAPYTIVFWVKPLAPIATGGAVGETAGTGWKMDRWFTAPAERWQRFRKVLVPPTSSQRLIIAPDIGAPHVLIDGLQVLKGRVKGPAGDFELKPARLSPNFVSDDAGTNLAGGTPVVGRAATGIVSRSIARGGELDLSRLSGFVPGKTYTVSFSVAAADGGDIHGRLALKGLTPRKATWSASGRRWHRVSVIAKATAPTAAFRIVNESPAALVDAFQVTAGTQASALEPTRLAPTGPASPGHVAAAQGTVKGVPNTVVGTLADSFDSGTVSGDNANARWRLAYWRFLLGRTLHEPLFGAGFGHGAHFVWHGIVYDARKGDPTDGNDVTPPHNSFVNIVYRMGLVAFVPLCILVAIAVLRAWKALHEGSPRTRAVVAGMLAIFAFITVTSSLNVALEGPYMSVFFWTILTMLLLSPRLTVPTTDSSEHSVPTA